MNEENEIEARMKPAKKQPIRILLDEPVEWGSETIKEITLNPIKGKHVKLLGKDPTIAQFIMIAAKCSGTSVGVFDEMSSGDVMRIVEEVGNLL